MKISKKRVHKLKWIIFFPCSIFDYYKNKTCFLFGLLFCFCDYNIPWPKVEINISTGALKTTYLRHFSVFMYRCFIYKLTQKNHVLQKISPHNLHIFYTPNKLQIWQFIVIFAPYENRSKSNKILSK